MANPDELVSHWTEHDLLDGKLVEAYVIIFNTVGCIFKGNKACTMCGYVNDASTTYIAQENLENQLKMALKYYQGQKVVKMYTSGSFLDPNEIPYEMGLKIIDQFSKAEKIVIETRPEFVSKERVKGIAKTNKKIYYAMGLETSNDYVRRKFINKTFSLDLYKSKYRLIKENNGYVKAYLMLKPPFITEEEAIRDTVQSVIDIKDYSDEISINPTNIQKKTIAENLFYKGVYRPPWLWSVVEALKQTSGIGIPIISKPTGGGTLRGAHNCFKCDNMVMNAIDKFVYSNDKEVFNDIYCPCQEEWKMYRKISNINLNNVFNLKYLSDFGL